MTSCRSARSSHDISHQSCIIHRLLSFNIHRLTALIPLAVMFARLRHRSYQTVIDTHLHIPIIIAISGSPLPCSVSYPNTSSSPIHLDSRGVVRSVGRRLLGVRHRGRRRTRDVLSNSLTGTADGTIGGEGVAIVSSKSKGEIKKKKKKSSQVDCL